MRDSVLGLYKFARKRFMQAGLHKMADVEKDQEMCIMIAFMVGAGISTDYSKFKDVFLKAQQDLDILKSMERERDE
jgi:hypothetical protein